MLTFKNQTFSTYREETLNGVDYLVVPGIPIQEQVLNYYFVNSIEIGKFVATWNGIPLVINHPKENSGSANVPVPDVPVIGTFYNASMDGKKLTGEFWFNLPRLRAAPGGDVIEKSIRNNRMLEISTGYFADELPVTGEYNGVTYTAVHQNIHPDHIAILPDAVGACSINDGCGLPRLNCSQNCAACALQKDKAMPETQEKSLLEKIRDLLGGAQPPVAAQNEDSAAPAPAAIENSQVTALNAEEYAFVRAFVSLTADLGGIENIKNTLLLLQKAQETQAAQEAAEAANKAAELAPALSADATPADATMNQTANPPAPAQDPVNYAGAVTPVPAIKTNAVGYDMSLPAAILSSK